MEALRCLPGVGPKSAQRMAFQLLQRDRSGGMRLAQALTRAMSEIGHCADCRTFTEQEHCTICLNPRRQQMVKSVWSKARQISMPLSNWPVWRALFCADGAFITYGWYWPW